MTDEILIRKVLDALPDYLQTNERVKEAIVSVISDVMVTKDYIKTLIEQSDRRFDELQKRSDEKFEALLKHSNAQFDKMQTQIDNRFNEVNDRFNEVDNRFNEVNDRFNEVDNRFNEVNDRFNEVDNRFNEVNDRFNEVDNRFNEVNDRFNEVDNRFNEVNDRFNEVNDRFDSVEEKIEKNRSEIEKNRSEIEKNRSEIEKNRVGLAELSKKGEDNFKIHQAQFNDLYSRGGKELEKTILELMKENLKLNNIDPEKITREELFDREGVVFHKNYNTDIDVLLENGNVYLVEVKSRLIKDNIAHFLLVARLYEELRKRKITQLIMICLRSERRIVNYGKELGMKIIFGRIIHTKKDRLINKMKKIRKNKRK